MELNCTWIQFSKLNVLNCANWSTRQQFSLFSYTQKRCLDLCVNITTREDNWQFVKVEVKQSDMIIVFRNVTTMLVFPIRLVDFRSPMSNFAPFCHFVSYWFYVELCSKPVQQSNILTGRGNAKTNTQIVILNNTDLVGHGFSGLLTPPVLFTELRPRSRKMKMYCLCELKSQVDLVPCTKLTSELRAHWFRNMKRPWKELKMVNRYWNIMVALLTANSPKIQVRPRIGSSTTAPFNPALLK